MALLSYKCGTIPISYPFHLHASSIVPAIMSQAYVIWSKYACNTNTKQMSIKYNVKHTNRHSPNS